MIVNQDSNNQDMLAIIISQNILIVFNQNIVAINSHGIFYKSN